MKAPLQITSILAAFLAATSAFATTSDVVGYVSKSVATGASLLSFPMHKAPQFSGAIDADGVSGDGLTLTISNLPSTIATPSYVQITSGAAAGAGVSIVSSTASSVTLESAITGLAAGDSLKIVEHSTLGDLTLASSSSIADASVVTIYNSDGSVSSYTTYANVWYDGGFANADDVIIFPGEGFVINSQGAVDVTFTGTVNSDAIDVDLTSGAINIVGTFNPSAPSGSDSLGAALSSLSDASTITVYSEDGALTAGETYTVYSGVWYDSGFGTPEISIAAPSVVVVNPQGSSTVQMPSAIN